MSWAGKQHPVETVIERFAPVPLALAVGWAAARLGFSPVTAIAFAILALAAGVAAIKLIGFDDSIQLERFAPADYAPVEPDELLLEEKDSVLELTDRLDDVGVDSRVVRLFARHEPTPGELVDRIVDFLSEGRRPTLPDRLVADTARPDASSALHDALANIRASLR